jgi:radical SAM protein with 4Fe4S-binding SPASM domain
MSEEAPEYHAAMYVTVAHWTALGVGLELIVFFRPMNIFSKIYRLSRIIFEYKLKKIALSAPPIRLWVESSLVCNLECTMCPNKIIPKADKGNMNFELYRKIIDEAREFASDVNIHHRGEPLANPRLPEMIRYAVNAGLKVRLHTNATLLDRRKAEEIITAKPDWVSVSFDGFQKDLYEKVRKGAHFEITVSNILGFLDARKRAKTRKPYITVERIDFAHLRDRVDDSQVNELAHLFKQRGIDELIVKKEFNWTTEATSAPPMPRTYSVCTFPWYAMVICWDGTVTPCPQDYMATMKLGNVGNNSIKEIWNDEPYQLLRRKLIDDVQSLPLCRRCDRLCRRQVAGLPFQYMIPFLSDHLLGYGPIRRRIGSFERN